MTEKSRDSHGRWRSKTIAFRVSQEENENINEHAKLSGLTKQEYICRRCQQKDIVVNGNPRVYKALKQRLEAIQSELIRIKHSGEISEALNETIRLVAITLEGLKKSDPYNEEESRGKKNDQ